jgi:hypothetical protein
MRLKAIPELRDDGLIWAMVCKECPLLPHLTALKEKPRDCQGGMMTNVQGAVPLGKCEYYVEDSFKDNVGSSMV